MNIQFPQIDIATTSDGLIELEQQCGLEDADRIVVHPVHIRTMAEQIGLIAPAPETAPDLPTYAEQARTIDRLQRNMLRLRQHALQTQDAMRCADWNHADLTFEMQLMNGMVDLCDMAVDDFADDYTARDPVDNATSHPVTPSHATPTDGESVAQKQLVLEG
jgi:hypothetical protein